MTGPAAGTGPQSELGSAHGPRTPREPAGACATPCFPHTTFAARSEEFTAVGSVSFRIPAAGSLAVVGQSGAGETTCARVIAGLESATEGRVEFAEGTAPIRPSPPQRSR
ncbi:ATP-binding cassette domain-containing protein [Streptomyces sp. AS02]|uniref:ATP-binding cassette domain-containing protein n=1 Tax=Streptomyces sp. AS02 TaxID=2938946 RepID=UPI0020229439|nr:ATP-binding cassette domain-containing protein [Streptomyces sp. AS02]MCL8011250.1 ATP-binding cassette domain-containing protein [Streptomyces sp. AS02]